MLDLYGLERYTENNRIEAKLSMGGLPESVWETYSSFANSMGGIILLGVEELPDRTLHPVYLPDAEALKEEFLRHLRDPERVSADILDEDSIHITRTDEYCFISVEVPRAPRALRPVYLDRDPKKCYIRYGDGDFLCTEEERLSFLRDAADETRDNEVLGSMTVNDLDSYTLSLFRKDLASDPLLEGEEETDTEIFLTSHHIAEEDSDGVLRPTAAGLLMFGKKDPLTEEFPSFCPEYLEVSRDGDFYIGEDAANVYTFYLKVRERLESAFGNDNGTGDALTEALVNCLVNADYRSDGSLLIIREHSRISFMNPGGFRIGIDNAMTGGISDPRNAVMLELFSMTDRARRTGSGIPSIFRLWKSMGWKDPLIAEYFGPGEMKVTLTLEDPSVDTDELKDYTDKGTLIRYLTDNVSAGAAEAAELLSTTKARARLLLQRLTDEGLLTVSGTNRNKKYRLTEKVYRHE